MTVKYRATDKAAHQLRTRLEKIADATKKYPKAFPAEVPREKFKTKEERDDFPGVGKEKCHVCGAPCNTHPLDGSHPQ